MARWGAIPKVFGNVHSRFQTPDVATLAMGALSVVWFVIVINVSKNLLSDSITALGFLIAFYYGLTGFACAVYYRRQIFSSVRNFVLLGLAPTLGGLMLLGIFIKAAIYYGHQANNYSPDAFGIGLPVVIGVGSLLLGVVVMAVAWVKMPAFFRRRPEVADPALL
jgi:amino acid transporter